MYCKNCGNELREGASFCTKCGANNNAYANVERENKKSKKSVFHWVIVSIIISIVIIAGCSMMADSSLKKSGKFATEQVRERIKKSTPIEEDEILYLSQYDKYNEERQIILDAASAICENYNAYDIPKEVRVWQSDGQGRYIINIKKVNTVSGEWDNVNQLIGIVESESKFYTNPSSNALLGLGKYSDFAKVKSYVKWGKPLQSKEDF